MGIDVGSGTTKGVITRDGEIFATYLLPSGIDYRSAAHNVREDLLEKAGLSSARIKAIVATGQGAASIDFNDGQATDIRCCARGINRLFPSARTVVDVQGQSSQVIRLSERGDVINFAVSEKCAAGSGRFLDVIANVLQVEIGEIGALSLQSKKPIAFTTGCAVFGESEVVSRVAEGAAKEDILAGVNQALASKIGALVDRAGLEMDCAISGGGALNAGLVRSVENELGIVLLVPSQPQFVTALGAALIAEGIGKAQDSK
jgi:predicted CoA-substrate-specific enzyme activase